MKCPHCTKRTVPLIDQDDGSTTCALCNREITGPKNGVRAEPLPPDPLDRPYRSLAIQRYRNSSLYKKSRRKHDKNWRESEAGKEVIRQNNERARLLRRLEKRLWELGL